MNSAPPRISHAIGPSVLNGPSHRLPENEIDLAISELMQAIKRRPFIILATLLLSLVSAMLYLSARSPTYQSTATLIIDPARPNILASQQVTELQIIDSGVVDSVVEIIASEFIAEVVARNLALAADREFMQESGLRRLIRPLRNWISPPRKATDAEMQRAAAITALRQLDVRRVGLTYVVEVTARSSNPETSAKLSNAFVDAYLENEMAVKLTMARKASSWLDSRTTELRDKLVEADAAVQRYRTEHNLIEPKGGKLPLDQQMAELTTKLSEVRGKEAAAKVLAGQVGRLIELGDFDSAAIAAPPENAVRKIRDTFIALSAREKDLATRVGSRHRLTLDAKAETEAARAQLRGEVRKYHESLRNEALSAATEMTQLETELAKLNVGQFEVGEKSIQLRELERNAESARLIYETFLTRLKEMRQQETMPVQDARLIAGAVPATNPSNVSMSLILGCALGSGLLGGILLALLRERFDPAIRSVKDAEAATGLRVMATLGEVRLGKGKQVGFPLPGPVARRPTRSGVNTDRLLTYAVDQPFSPFAEGFRHLRLLLNRYATAGAKTVGIVSASPGEGKSTVACNLAYLYAAGGARTILIDCDLRNPTLSEKLSSAAVIGLPDVLLGRAALADAVQIDARSNLALLPGKSSLALGNPADILAQPALDDLIDTVSKNYDVVVLDIAPFALASDALIIAPLIDIFVLVIASGTAKKAEVQFLLDHAPEIREKTAGVVLNLSPNEGRKRTYPAARPYAQLPAAPRF